MTNLVSIQEKQEQAENRDRIFVEEYVQNGGNATRAAIASGANESSASTVGYRLKRRLQNKINDEQKAALKGYSSNALTNIQTLAETAVSEKVKLDANKDLLDRAGWKPVDRSEVTTHDDVKNKTHDEIMEELDALHRRCGLKTVAIDSVVLDKEHPDYQHYLNTEPELADFTSEVTSSDGAITMTDVDRLHLERT
jgi:phage terminase small subunit|tara:strand:- start:4104 stop:4691 length:588 start_codon:yes stop_codon:yes gene_type:complete